MLIQCFFPRSRADLDGANAEAERVRLLQIKVENVKNNGKPPAQVPPPPAPVAYVPSPKRRPPREKSSATDSHNADYEQWLKDYKTKDFLAEQRELQKQAWER